VQPLVAVLELQRGRVTAERDADVVDGGNKIVEDGRLERAGLDDLPLSAHVAALDAVGDARADALGVRVQEVGRGALLDLAGLGAVSHCLLRWSWPQRRPGSRSAPGGLRLGLEVL
jgi:hypothetical protein